VNDGSTPRDLNGSVVDAAGTALFPNQRPPTVVPARPICSLAIDAEEDFDWDTPVQGTRYSTGCMRHVQGLHDIVNAYGLRPTYLLTYPVLDDEDVVCILDRQLEKGQCDVGVQLHPWVNPPFDREEGESASYLGSLTPESEERKLVTLKAKFRERFGRDPLIFRAGRYGLGRRTAGLLEAHGFEIDTSLAPRTDFSLQGGPDFSAFDCDPFWFGRDRALLELPLCRSLVGWGGPLAAPLYRAVSTSPFDRLHLQSLLSRMRCAERVTLSPEGNDFAAMRRLLRHLLGRGQKLVSVSFHSSSLAVGSNPYVQSKADLHAFYDRLSEILDMMASEMDFAFHALSEIPSLIGGAAH
jgi:hypothetical protein